MYWCTDVIMYSCTYILMYSCTYIYLCTHVLIYLCTDRLLYSCTYSCTYLLIYPCTHVLMYSCTFGPGDRAADKSSQNEDYTPPQSWRQLQVSLQLWSLLQVTFDLRVMEQSKLTWLTWRSWAGLGLCVQSLTLLFCVTVSLPVLGSCPTGGITGAPGPPHAPLTCNALLVAYL